MIRVDTIGLVYYEITGDKEKEAAAEYETRYWYLTRSPFSGSDFLLDEQDLIADLRRKYDVKIICKP